MFFPRGTDRDFMEILKLVDALQIADKHTKKKNGLQAVRVLNQNGIA